MATTTTQEPLAGHDADPIVRDKLYIGGEWIAPAGTPSSSKISASTKALRGTTSDGLSTTVQPTATAGATFAATWCSG